ncbi:hypothetical protein GCM10019016_047900 [Streptomyces prasinosporus]|uniref:Uncharacterized protein n=1 Tax=Streptomyces prasinosporus TaxID=68256 RepID=A0ABP6TRJ7_9ACTN|nr:hypothetical protein GCM10010332_52230 [Streptomyces albogriseolus]
MGAPLPSAAFRNKAARQAIASDHALPTEARRVRRPVRAFDSGTGVEAGRDRPVRPRRHEVTLAFELHPSGRYMIHAVELVWTGRSGWCAQ